MENETLLKVTERSRSVDEEIDKSSEEFPQRLSEFRRNDEHLMADVVWRILPWIAHLMFFSISLFFLLDAITIRNSLPTNCMEGRRQWLITMGSIPDKYHFERSNGTFDQSSSPYKGPPSPAVDAAWAELIDYGAISITEEVFQQLNASKNAVKVPEKYGGGRQAFVEVIHQLHCLKVLWEHTYPEYYVEAAEYTRNNDQEWHAHNDHCADMLRQKLTCESDVQILTYNWLKGHEAPHPNFNTPRQCRDFNVIKTFALDHAIDGSDLPKGRFVKPKDGSVREYDEPPSDPQDEGWPSQP